ncbi:MAG: hypothetical protein J6D06_00935 [Clostridia bacterium]|nr:hypothetical protein [Clostridia bacterium]
MSERYKLGLTRNRLFEFDNCVVFAGRYDCSVEQDKGDRSIKLLSLKEPLVTARVELEKDGEAFAVAEQVAQKLNLCDENHCEVLKKYELCGLNFWERLFEFTVSSDGYFIIAGHTCVADAKALLRIAVWFSEIYNSDSLSVEPSETVVVSQKSQLPLEVLSPITDKLSVELDSKWLGKSCVFGVEDYKRAKRSYDASRSARSRFECELSEEVVCGLKSYCAENCVDVSSVIGFAFYEELCKNIPLKTAASKMNVYGDSRFFFEDNKKYGVGAYNGVVNVCLKKKDKMKTDDERLKAFHINIYKGVTSAFKVFYDDAFMMSVSPSLCDSAYMYAAGEYKNKASAKFADNYGCKNEMLCDYFSCNLEQAFWSELKRFSDITVEEPFKMRSLFCLNFVLKDGKGFVTFRYKESLCNDKTAEVIFKNAVENITAFSQK